GRWARLSAHRGHGADLVRPHRALARPAALGTAPPRGIALALVHLRAQLDRRRGHGVALLSALRPSNLGGGGAAPRRPARAPARPGADRPAGLIEIERIPGLAAGRCGRPGAVLHWFGSPPPWKGCHRNSALFARAAWIGALCGRCAA